LLITTLFIIALQKYKFWLFFATFAQNRSYKKRSSPKKNEKIQELNIVFNCNRVKINITKKKTIHQIIKKKIVMTFLKSESHNITTFLSWYNGVATFKAERWCQWSVVDKIYLRSPSLGTFCSIMPSLWGGPILVICGLCSTSVDTCQSGYLEFGQSTGRPFYDGAASNLYRWNNPCSGPLNKLRDPTQT
jgi:hypothetical protein